MRFTPGGDDFPSPCRFCGHPRLAEGVCQCPGTCEPCLEGCCGNAILRPLAAAAVPDDEAG
jgi:hypothetical protein